MTAGSSFACILDIHAKLGEGPVWSAAEQVLYWVDIKGRTLNRFDPAAGTNHAMEMPEEIGCAAPRKGGGFIAGLRSGIWELDGQGRPVACLAANPEDQAASRFNDGRVDPVGRYLAGTLDEPKAGGKAHLYRYDRRGLAVLAGGLLTSNGLAFSPDGRTLYHADTPTFTVRRYRYDPASGEMSDGEVFVRLQPAGEDRGRPDGAAVDADGCYWAALYEGGRVARFAPDGTLLSEHPLPARCPTMVAFGGPDLRTLYVTTASAGRPAEELERFPQSGGLFAMRVEVPGLPLPSFDPAA
ncbi:SMP-30/gluconolactonase/LRE family protein [Azospirillum picis]|uniref:Sugar lactone lactonase YvrE n=1 Tax=Azospirillum picis TaxID=488438 RepID=A0ABU0MTA7_9PROT|nr:SMP-30/gluconolactonase/LRE family protein [Azospirillum picis]MBP2302834.1 sugar lactone lactonase YvrE [Azospirillum picis]MDQ0536661.1 sugar lactone lactonase YvrE [Azospirillum picis]